MNPGRLLRQARRRAELTQKELAARAGMPQSTIARIETGAIDPRATTLDRLLRACDFELESVPLLGRGIDRTLIHSELELTPGQRVANTVKGAEFVQRLRRALADARLSR